MDLLCNFDVLQAMVQWRDVPNVQADCLRHQLTQMQRRASPYEFQSDFNSK